MVHLVAAAALFTFVTSVSAHSVAWAKGMYCQNGLSNEDDPQASEPANPLFNLTREEWFWHGECRNFPPPASEYLEIPAGGSFTVEIAENRAFTTMSYDRKYLSEWGDGENHPDDYSILNLGPNAHASTQDCIESPNIHAKSQRDAAGTVFAIAYESDLAKLTIADLVVFTVAPNTPFMRLASYEVPALMPACPPGGCLCAWGWVPDHCGQANVYMNGYRCRVTGARDDARPLAQPKPARWCQDNWGECVTGPKMMVIDFQAEGNTFNSSAVGLQRDGLYASPGYNEKMGFFPGPQNDIFEPAVPPSRKSTTSRRSVTIAKDKF